MHDIKPAYARGYLGEDTISGNKTTVIDLFNNFQGSFDIEQLQLALALKTTLVHRQIFRLKKLVLVIIYKV